MNQEEIQYSPSTLETIDYALFNWINNDLNIFSNTTDGWKKVPVIWTSSERVHQMKSDKDIRDSSGMLKFPIISVERKNIVKDVSKSPIPANIKSLYDKDGAALTITRVINQEKTSNFKNADLNKYSNPLYRNNGMFSVKDPRRIKNNKIVYQTASIPMQIYVFINYEIHIKTDYMQQLNEIITPFYVKNGNQKAVTLRNDNYKYEAFIKEITPDNNSSALNEERKVYSAKIDMEVVGKLSYSGDNLDKPKVTITENAVEVKIPRERVIMGDTPEYYDLIKNKTSYRD
jgi:hypothetical protein